MVLYGIWQCLFPNCSQLLGCTPIVRQIPWAHFAEPLSKRLAAHDLPCLMAKSIRDIYFDIHSCMAFPTQGLKLKDIAKWCGFKWRQSQMDGFEAATLYGSSGNLTKAAKREVIEYNEDDLLALKHVLLYCTKMQELESVGTNASRSL